MQLSHAFSALSFGLLSLALGAEALAAPGVLTRTGRFSVAALAPSQRASGSALEKAARSLLSEQLPSSRGAELGRATTVELASGERVVKMPQLHQGVPVAHRGVAVTFGADNVASVVSAAIEADLPSTVKPQITAAAAAAVASRAVGVEIDPAHAQLAVFPTPNGAKLVWGLEAPVFGSLFSLPVVIVDATSGGVLLRYNAARAFNQAGVYPSNPVKSPSLIDVTLPVGLNQSTLQNDLIKATNCIDTQKVQTFQGIQIHFCELLQISKPDGNGDYLSIKPAEDAAPEDPYSELSMFYHANRAYDFFRAFQPTLLVEQGPLTTVSNARVPQGLDTFDLTKLADPSLPLVPSTGAAFVPTSSLFSILTGLSGGSLIFGQGPTRDFSYDGDVIYHEFTHAVVHVTLKLTDTPHLDEYGVSLSPSAMNEGLADFFSAALSGDPDLAEYAAPDYDPGNPSASIIRTLANSEACPTSISGELHQDSLMFSGALWDARKALSAAQQAEFDGAIFKAMNSSPTGDLGYEELADLIIASLKSSPLGQPVADALSAAFGTRGLLPRCTRVLEATGEGMAGPKGIQGNGWYAPGTQTTGVKAMMGEYTPGIVQFHRKLEGSAAKLTVSFTGIDLTNGMPGMDSTVFTPKLLVRFGKDPIQFTYNPLNTTADVALVSPTSSGTTYTATVDVPSGATEAYVMVGSTGDADGLYTALQITEETTPNASSSSMSSATGATGAGGSGAGGGGDEPTEMRGCGCTVPGQDNTSDGGAALGLVAALGLIAARRRAAPLV